MSPKPLRAHSLLEIDLYFMATVCDRCGRGGLKCEGRRAGPDADRPGVVAEVRCEACGHESVMRFVLVGDGSPPDRDDLYPIINASDEPSEILDVGQWIVLFRVVLEAASNERDKIEARRKGYEAAQCLEEAIKFYEDDDDLPPAEAIFCEASRQRRREHPEQFSRHHLLDMRAKLPALTTMQRQMVRSEREESTPHRGWWRFWRR